MSLKLEGHRHRLYHVEDRDNGLECDACDGAYRYGYTCRTCKFTIHRRCAFVFNVRTFRHPSHGHYLELLTTGAPEHTDPKCHFCCKNTKGLLYHCSICKISVDIDCMVDDMCPPSQTFTNMQFHPHPMFVLNFYSHMRCQACGLPGDYGLFCPICRLSVHAKCYSKSKLPRRMDHPCHVRHPLKLLSVGAPDCKSAECHICGKETENLLYRCDMCKFNLDIHCAVEKSPSVSLSNLMVHEHALKLMPRLVSFVCDACGEKDDRAPYVCVQCDFLFFHRDCAHLPRVIHVNHHDHRVSYKYPLGPGDQWRCGVCWEEIDWSYGAYSCSICPSYALHSRCATSRDVWDGEELYRVPEKVEDLAPFVVNEDNTITHFGHEHNLSLNRAVTDLEESILCHACVRPIGSNAFFYQCSSSDDFILHEKCANLPKKKRHFLSPKPLTLHPHRNRDLCDACLQICSKGYMYGNFDLLCSEITVPFIHGSHPHHPLLYLNIRVTTTTGDRLETCQACGVERDGPVIGCTKCNFFLDFRCATLPLTVRLQRYDDHPLTLCYGEEASGKYWCDICERETDPKFWFYTCQDCGVTLHVLCVLGDVRYAKHGGEVGYLAELLRNVRPTRPICCNCKCRCQGPFIVVQADEEFYCSYYCFGETYQYVEGEPICPPWALEANTR